MMIGLSGGLGNPGDVCLDLMTGSPAPCDPSNQNLLCASSSQGGQSGPCSVFGESGYQVPILTLGDMLQRCNTPQCQIISAVPPGAQACDPLVMAAGYQCQTVGGGKINVWSKNTIVGGKLYTSDQGVINAPSANQYGLNPQQVSYLIQAGIVNPVSSMNQPLIQTANPSVPTSGPGAPQSVIASYIQAGVPTAAALPYAPNALPSIPMVPAGSQTPTTIALGTGTPPSGANPVAPGTIPGSNTAANGPAAYASQPATTGDLLPGIPNNYLYIGGAALLLLLVMKK